ncbi:MAG: HEAT repeat domain-containing protein [Terriglobales bacterium]
MSGRTLAGLLVCAAAFLAGCGREDARYIRQLDDPNPRIRVAAVEALGRSHKASARDPLMKMLKDQNREVREAATTAIAAYSDAAAAEALLQVLHEEHEYRDAIRPGHTRALRDGVRGAALRGLVAIGEPAVQPLLTRIDPAWPLRGAMDSGNLQMRTAVVMALGEIRDRRALPALRRVVTEATEPWLQQEAAEALGRFPPEGTSILMDIVLTGTPPLRDNAALGLGRGKDPAALEPLLAMLKHKTASVRTAAARALGLFDDERAVRPLMDALLDKDGEGTLAAETALANLGPLALPQLTAGLRSDRADLREEARRAMEWIREDTRDDLIALLNDRDGYVVRSAAAALAHMARGGNGDKRVVELLDAALRDKNLRVVAGAQAYYVSKGQEGTEPLLIDALRQHGYQEMAENFLNSGNPKLEGAGNAWARNHGFDMMRISMPGGSNTWGSR